MHRAAWIDTISTPHGGVPRESRGLLGHKRTYHSYYGRRKRSRPSLKEALRNTWDTRNGSGRPNSTEVGGDLGSVWRNWVFFRQIPLAQVASTYCVVPTLWHVGLIIIHASMQIMCVYLGRPGCLDRRWWGQPDARLPSAEATFPFRPGGPRGTHRYQGPRRPLVKSWSRPGVARRNRWNSTLLRKFSKSLVSPSVLAGPGRLRLGMHSWGRTMQ